jgi:hypothetical protein
VNWLGRAGVLLLPAGRRDWAEAVWAEAHEVPAGWPRLAWQAGGVWLIAKEAKMARWIGSRMVFAAAAGAAAWAAWPAGPAATVRADVIATVLLLAGLPLLARWFLGPPGNRAARWLRAGCYAAILALMPAKAVIELFLGAVPRGGIDLRTYDVFQCHNAVPVVNCLVPGTSTGGPVPSEVMLLLLTACGLAVILALTARRTRVAPATLAVGAGTGLALGAVMYAVAPLGSNFKFPDRPWLHGAAVDPFMVLFWILLFGAPLAAGAVAGWRCHVPDDAGQASAARARQGLAAGLVCGGVGAAFVTVLGTGTTALLVKSAWVRGWLYHGQHLTASAVYGRELFASQDVTGYFFLAVGFLLIGLAMALTGAGIANATRPLPDGGRPGGPGGPPGPEPVPVPPDGGRLTDAGADQDRPLGLYDDGEGEGDQGTPGLVGAGLERAW